MAAKYRKEGRIAVLSWKHPRKNGFLVHSSIVEEEPGFSEHQLYTASKTEDEKIIWALIRNTNPNACISDEHSQSEPLIKSSSNPLRKSSTERKKRERMRSKRIEKEATQSHEFAEFYMVQLVHREDVRVPESFNEWAQISQDVSVSGELIFVESLAELKESYRQLHRLCTGKFSQTSEEHWWSLLDNTRWLDQIRNLMSGAHRLVKLMEQGSTVYLSCEGWDRGCQISSLAQLWMDPYYRTLRGFIVLVEKEWLSFGHPFTHRAGYVEQDDSPEVVPVFLQWLDCVWQTMLQFPNQFEFNNLFLVQIVEHIYSGEPPFEY
jgi:hypothetical protein